MKIIEVMKIACERLAKSKGRDMDAEIIVRGIVDHVMSPKGELFQHAREVGSADLVAGIEAGSTPEKIISRVLCRFIYDGAIWVPSEWIAEALAGLEDTAGWHHSLVTGE